MRFGAFRRLSAAALVVVATVSLIGCSSPTKRHYLRHLSIVIEPAEPGSVLVSAFDTDRGIPAVTAAAVADGAR